MLSFGLLLVTFAAAHAYAQNLEVAAQWNLLDFNFPIGDYGFGSNFRPERTVATGFEVTDDRIFIAMPRIYYGVPATLAYVPRNVPLGVTPKLQAYPNWNYHEVGRGNNNSCDGLVSVYRLKQDSCNRLWVLDSGIQASLEEFRRLCPPKIIIFDLNTDQPVRTIIFPEAVLRPSSLLTNLIIDESIQGVCDSAFVYISDTVTPGIVVYDSLTDRAWRVMHPSMFPDPDYSDSTIAGESMTLMDGIVGLAHSINQGVLYYQPFATNRIYSVPTAALRKGPPAELEVLPVSLVGTKSSQGIGLAVDQRDDSLYFSPVTETSIASWNPVTNQQRLWAYDPVSLQFVADLHWNNKDGSIWIIASRFQKYFRRTVNANEVNVRVIRLTGGPQNLPTINNNNILFK